MQWKYIIKCLRPKQWIKNTFIFLPLFFGGKILNTIALTQTTLAFVGFCLLASAIYIINDIADINEDKNHPFKKYRPIASGNVSIKNGICLSIILLIISFIIFWFSFSSNDTLICWIAYLALNILYTFALKKHAIVDVIVIALGFVIRLYLGAVVGDIILSNWIIVLMFILALFLAFGKRRDDLNNLEINNSVSRKGIHVYSIEYLNVILGILSAIIVVTYIQYTLSVEVIERFGQYLFTTALFVLMGVLRYLQVIIVKKTDFDPTNILWKDRFLQLIILAWILLFAYFIYF